MMKYFMTDNQVIHEEEKLQDGVWVRMISPTQEECEEIADVLNVDIDDIKAALDEEESSRIELQDGYTLILTFRRQRSGTISSPTRQSLSALS